jgi:5,6-dimethylbenzimidazole synthase
MRAFSTPGFAAAFEDLVRWRRDVRRFRTDPVSDAVVMDLLQMASLAPSVGNAQPWRFVLVDEPERRRQVAANFESSNQAALAGYSGDRAQLYANLKLEGLREAPVHLAVFCDHGTQQGHRLGARTMPETLDYSVVCAVHTLWLAARVQGLGVGWISILDLAQAARSMNVAEDWRLVAYLCVGYPVEEHTDPELERRGWQARSDPRAFIHRR